MMKRIILSLILSFTMIVAFGGPVFAHSPYLMVSDNEDGTVDISGGYSDGQSAAGGLILLKSKETEKILWQGKLDEYGDLTITKQQEPYIIVFDGGPGHILKKDGPFLTPMLTPLETPITQIYPLQDDFEYVKDIFPKPLMLQDPSGVIKIIPIMQGYRYHHGKGLAKIMKKLEAKRKKGAKVDFKINDVPLCFGVTTGFLSLKFAINKLYGEEIPKADDFKIMAADEMCSGIRDMYSLYFGRELDYQDITDFDREGCRFIAERFSTGKKIVFGYNIRVFPELNKLISAKKNPGEFKNIDFENLKRDITKKLFLIKDYSYFKVIEKNEKERNLRPSPIKQNSEPLGKLEGFLQDGGDREAGEVDRIEKQAERIAKGDIKGLTLDERGRLLGEEEYFKSLRLKLGEIFVGECKKITKEKKAGKIYEFWELAEKDGIFLEEIGRDFLATIIRFGQRHPELLNNLARWEYLGVKRYFEEKGSPVEQGEIKQEAKNIVLGALHPWQFSKKGRLVLSDSFIVEEMAKRGNKGVVMDIGISAGISTDWYALGKSTEPREKTLPGATFVELADKLADKNVKVIGVDIETLGLEGLLKEIREGKVEEALKKRYSNPQIDYLRADLIDSLPVKDESIDLIRVAHVFPYIAQDKPKMKALLNIRQALKEEGLLIFINPNPESAKHHIVKDEKGEIIKVNPIKSDYEVYRKEKGSLVYQGRLSWNEAKKVELKKRDEKPLLAKYLSALHIPLWARAAFPDINAERAPQELTEFEDLNKQRAIILNEKLFTDNPGAALGIINTNRQLAKTKGLKLVLALSEPDRAGAFYEAIKETTDGNVDLKGQFDYVVSARKKAKAVVRDVQSRFPELESIEVIGPEAWAKNYKALKIGKGTDAKQCIVIVCGLGKGNYITNGAGAFEYGLKALLLDTGILGFEDTEKIARLRDKKTGFFVVKVKKVGKETQAIIRRYRTVLASK